MADTTMVLVHLVVLDEFERCRNRVEAQMMSPLDSMADRYIHEATLGSTRHFATALDRTGSWVRSGVVVERHLILCCEVAVVVGGDHAAAAVVVVVGIGGLDSASVGYLLRPLVARPAVAVAALCNVVGMQPVIGRPNRSVSAESMPCMQPTSSSSVETSRDVLVCRPRLAVMTTVIWCPYSMVRSRVLEAMVPVAEGVEEFAVVGVVAMWKTWTTVMTTWTELMTTTTTRLLMTTTMK
jgi:hypothetical protein